MNNAKQFLHVLSPSLSFFSSCRLSTSAWDTRSLPPPGKAERGYVCETQMPLLSRQKKGLARPAKAKLNAVNQLEVFAAGDLHVRGPKSAYVPLRRLRTM
jgi:hypothetical protein